VTPKPWPEIIEQFISSGNSSLGWKSIVNIRGGVALKGHQDKIAMADDSVLQGIMESSEKHMLHRADMVELGKILASQLATRGIDNIFLLEALNIADSQYARLPTVWPKVKAQLQAIPTTRPHVISGIPIPEQEPHRTVCVNLRGVVSNLRLTGDGKDWDRCLCELDHVSALLDEIKNKAPFAKEPICAEGDRIARCILDELKSTWTWKRYLDVHSPPRSTNPWLSNDWQERLNGARDIGERQAYLAACISNMCQTLHDKYRGEIMPVINHLDALWYREKAGHVINDASKEVVDPTDKTEPREPVLNGTQLQVIRILFRNKAFTQGTGMSSGEIHEKFPNHSNATPKKIANQYRRLKELGLLRVFKNGQAGKSHLTPLGKYWAGQWFDISH